MEKQYMAYLTGKSETRIEEAFIFGESPLKIRASEEYKDFKSDGYEEEAMFFLEAISGSAVLPNYIERN